MARVECQYRGKSLTNLTAIIVLFKAIKGRSARGYLAMMKIIFYILFFLCFAPFTAIADSEKMSKSDIDSLDKLAIEFSRCSGIYKAHVKLLKPTNPAM